MTFQIFPNKFKSIGLLIFIICCGLPAILAFILGISQPFQSNETTSIIEQLLNSPLPKWLNILTILGMLMYMLSKEKIEDDYITKLRLESYQLTTILCLAITFVLLLFENEMMFSLSHVIFIFVSTYLITFRLKKRNSF